MRRRRGSMKRRRAFKKRGMKRRNYYEVTRGGIRL